MTNKKREEEEKNQYKTLKKANELSVWKNTGGTGTRNTQKQNSSSSGLGIIGTSAYQQNLSQPSQTNTEIPNTRQVLGKIWSGDKSKAADLYSQFKTLQQDETSPWYNPYTKATNQAIGNLSALGIDVSNIDDDWFNNNRYLMDYYNRSGTTNNPTSPGKKATREQQAAYQYYQVWQAEDKTKKAEQEWAALQEELKYKATVSPKNLSDDAIINSIDWSKYKTLQEMDDEKKSGTPVELNRAVGYSKDAMYGALWAARNNGGYDDMDTNMAMSALGYGNQWQADLDISERLDPNSDKFNPYSVGVTDLEDAALYFNVPYFDNNWIAEHKGLAFSDDKTEREMYQKVLAAEQNTIAAEEAIAALNWWIENKAKDMTPEEAKKKLDNLLAKKEITIGTGKNKQVVNIDILNKMDESIGKEDNPATGKLLAMTRSVDYRYIDALNKYVDMCTEKATELSGLDYVESNTDETTPKTSVPVMPEDTSPVGQPVGETKEPETSYSEDVLNTPAIETSGTTPGTQETPEPSGPVSTPVPASTESGITVSGSEEIMRNDASEETEEDAAPLDVNTEVKAEPAKPKVNAVKFPDQVRELMKQRDKNLADGTELFEDLLQGAEKDTFETTSAATEEVTNFWTYSDPGNLLQKSTADTAIGFAGKMTANASGYTSYVEAVTDLPLVQEEIKMLEDSVQATQDELDKLNGLKDMTYKPDWLLNIQYELEDYSESSLKDTNALIDLYEYVTGRDYDENYNQAQVKDWADYIFDPEREFVETAYEGDKNSRLLTLQRRELDLQNAIEENKDAYSEYDQTNLWFEATIAAYEDQGLDTTELYLAKAVGDYLSQMSVYQPTVWDTQSYYQGLSAEGKTDDEISQIHAEQADLLDNAKFVREYITQNGMDVSETIISNLDRYIAALERDEQDYQYYALKNKSDFKEGVDAGKAKEEAEKIHVTGPVIIDSGTIGTTFELAAGLEKTDFYKYMNQDEIDTYYYLYGTKGIEAAYQYCQHLKDDTYGVLLARQREKTEEYAEGEVNSGFFGGAWANLKSMASAPMEGIMGLAYFIDRALTGKEYNPNSSYLNFGHYSAKVNEATMQSIVDVCGKDGQATTWSKVVSGLYEILYNRGRSAMNAAVFNFFSDGSKVIDMVKEFVGAAPMAIGAASMAAADAKDKGATDGQAYAIATATFFAEDLSEGLTASNIHEAFGGEGFTPTTVREALVHWLTSSGVEEMIGESANEIVETLTDTIVMGELSDHEDRVNNHYEQLKKDNPRLSDDDAKEQAEELARRDEIAGLLHTALISYLSPGLDLVSMPVRAAHNNLSMYRAETKRLQQNGVNVNLMEVRKAYNEAQKSGVKPAAQTQNAKPVGTPAAGPQRTVQGVSVAAPVASTDIRTGAKEESAQMSTAAGVLGSVNRANTATQNAAVAKVIGDVNVSREASDTAFAAASALRSIFGSDQQKTMDSVKAIISGAYAAGVNSMRVRSAIRTAALSPSSQARQVVTSDQFQASTPEQKAEMLGDTFTKDTRNEAVASEMANSVTEWRIATEEAKIISEGGILKAAQAAQNVADAARQEANAAQEKLDNQRNVEQAANDAAVAANEEAINNPTDENRKNAQQATNQLQHQADVTNSYQEGVNAAKQRENEAQQKADQVARDALNETREQGAAAVAQQNQQRAEEAAQAAEQQRIAEKQAVQAQIDQEATDNATIADADAFIEQYHPDATEEEKQHIREAFDRISKETPAESTIRDENGQLSEKAKKNRDKFIKRVSNKFGVKIDIVDTTQGGNVDRQNGYVDLKNNRIVIDETASMDDAMLFVLGHELTHIAEKSGTYSQLAQSLLRMRYGSDEERLAADIRARKSLYDFRLARMHEQDNTIDATPLTEEQAGQEIVADIMGDLLRGDQDLANRLVAEEPSLVRRIIDSIKSFIKKATGMKGAWLSNAQQTVDMLEAALKDSQSQSSQQEGEVKHSLMEFQDGKRFVNLDIMQDEFDNLSPDEMRKKAKNIIREYFMGKVVGIDNKAFVNGQTANEFAYPSKFISDDEASVKMRASTELDNLIDAGEYDRHEADGRDGHFHDNVVGGFDYYKTIFKIGNEYFEGEVNIANLNKGKKFHDVTKIRNITQDIMSSYGQNPKSQFLRNVSMENVAQDKRVVKPLVTDDQGNEIATELPGGTAVVDPDVKWSLSSFTKDEQEKVRQALLKTGNYTRQQVDQYLADATSIAAKIASDRVRWDYDVTDPNKSMMKSNSDYGASIDASTLCAKRLLYQGTFDAIQHALPNTPLLPEDLINLSNMMREMGYETPCGICYVESRRRNLGKYTEEWLKNYNGEYVPKVDEVTTSDGLEKLRKEHPQAYKDFMDAMNSHGKQNNPKPVQLRTEYKGEIRELSDRRRQKFINHGGIRLQSFSDFETPHLLDMMQVVMDIASKKLTAQAYTKVPNFAWAFGDTGVKINLSLIGKGEGVDENGNLVFDDREGMPFDEAMKLRDRYSKNVGTILVGINDRQILAAMADPRIDYIIPFHSSGWTKEDMRLMPTIEKYTDYQNYQTEKDVETGARTSKNKGNNIAPVGQKDEYGNGYWDFNKSGKENAEEYLRLCAKNGLVPVFSQFLDKDENNHYHLKVDGSTDGYWKLLIDFKMYENGGDGSQGVVKGSPQLPVTPNVNMAEAYRIMDDYSLERNGVKMKDNNSLPVAQPVVDRYVEEYKAKNPGRKYSLPNAAEMDQAYEDAFNAYDDDEGERLVAEAAEAAMPDSKVRDENGNLKVVYHQTNGGDFTVFDIERARTSMDVPGFFFAPEYDEYHEYGDRTIAAYLDIKNPKYDVFDLDFSQNEAGQRKRDELIAQGYDGIINTEDGKIFEYVAFYPEQVKSAEAFTEDDDGDLIPLSERFNSNNPDIRYSLPEDAPYMAAVERGEMDEAKKEVEQYAASKGYTEKAYHGTNGFGFTQFDLEGSQDALFVAYDQDLASTYTYGNDIREVSEGGIKNASPEELAEILNSQEDALYFLTRKKEGDPKTARIEYNPETGLIDVYELHFKGDFDTSGTFELAASVTPEEAAEAAQAQYEEIIEEHKFPVGRAGIYELYTRPGNQLVVELDGEAWNQIPWYAVIDATEGEAMDWQEVPLGGHINTRRLADIAKRHGYDSVRINGVLDSGEYQSPTSGEPHDIGIFFKQDDLKSADTVTRDDNGNVIPLSERFTDKPDIRYSLPSDNLLEQQIRQYLSSGGSLSTNTTPAESNLPGTPGMRPQRQFGRQTAQTSNALHDEVKDYLYNHSSYTPDSNQEQINRAVDWVQSMASTNDPDGYFAALREVTSDNFDYRSADGQARMLTVMSMAALKAEDGDQNALNDELRLADAYNKQGTDLGRQLQARKIFRLMTPLGRVAALESMQDQVNEDLGRSGRETRVQLSNETIQEAANAQTEEEFEKARKKAAQELAKQVPANWKDKLRGWRMLSMLGNPRTHIRNIVGNAMFAPVVSLKNKLGAVSEIVTRQDQRTKTLAPILSRDIRNFAKADAIAMKDTLTGEAKYNESTMVEREQKAFKGLLQAIIDFNSNLLEKEDWVFLKGHYKRALGGWMQANGYTSEQLSNNPQLLEKGREYAIQEAQKATYRDFNGLAAKLNELSRNPKTFGQAALAFGTEAMLPFKKTPANILKRGIEYSPVGIMRSLTTDIYHLKQWNDYKNKKLSVLPEKAISPNQFIDRLCSGLAGSAILMVGALLSSAGIVTCGLDDDDDKLEKEQGNQEYSFKFNIAGQDFTFTVDWAAPMSMPFFVGAAIQEQFANRKGFNIENLLNALGNIAEPVFNLSMLDGVNSLFKTSKYDDTDTLTQIGAKVVSNYATSYVPSLMGAIARTVDDTRRKAYVESGKGTGVLGTFRYAYEQTQNKIPGWSQTNIPVRDVFGNPETSSLAERILENFILPGYVSKYKNDPVLNEMARLYDVTGDPSMIPADPGKTVTYKKEKYVLSAEQWDQYKTERGQTAYNALTELINSKDYQDASEDTQTQMIKDVWSYADKVGKQAVIPDFEMDDMGPRPVETITKDAKIASYKEDMLESLANGDYEGYETMIEALHEENVEDSAIKTKIADTYRDQWKDAYRKGDFERMNEIEEILDNTGFDFNIYGKNGWEDKVIEKYGEP